MITVEEAKQLLNNLEVVPDKVILPIDQTVGLRLAEDVYSSMSVPSFDNSAVDGFVLTHKDYKETKQFTVAGEIQAGLVHDIELEEGEAYRIFTGAKVPVNGELVVMQELTELKGDQLTILKEDAFEGQHIRRIGEQIKQGDLALEKGFTMNPAAVGLLASIGIAEIPVYRYPKVAIAVTGNELKDVGEDILEGEIYDSNSPMLKAALLKVGIIEISFYKVLDDFESTKQCFQEALLDNDILIVSGGISVGKYDYVKEALLENGVNEVFHKVKQKPGKPLFVGSKGNKFVFGLPGNPAAALVGFYEYIQPLIQRFAGIQSCNRITQKTLKHAYNKKGDRAIFLKAFIDHNDQVEVLDGQESFILSSFAKANALAYVRADEHSFKKEDQIEIHPLHI